MRERYFDARHLSVGYDGHALIKDICLSIDKGEVVTLIGPNGAGKSTILKSISRQMQAIAGAVYIDQQDMAKIPRHALAQRMALVLTQRTNPELMSCRDVVAMGRYPYTGRLGVLSQVDEELVSLAMRTVRVEALSERDFAAISDGQRQRVLLARALCQQPEVIILDEPTSFLDIRHKLELLSLLREMAREQGITVIMSLHEIDLAQKVSDKIVCVKGDRIDRFGVPEDVFSESGVQALFDVEQGFFDPLFGNVELPRPGGAPEVFVISGCGTGIPIYRALQREHVAFAAGILYTNDVDWQLARLLASEVVEEAPFCEISDAAFERAIELLHSCKRVVVAEFPIEQCNLRMRDLIERGMRMNGLRT